MARAKKNRKNLNNNLNKLKSGDFLLMFFTCVLIVIGLIMVFSASYYWSISHDGTPYSYLCKHAMWVVIGFFAMMAGALIDYRAYKKFTVPIMVGIILLLVIVLTSLGQTANGSTRWLGFGPITIMPGELAKLAMILFVAWYFGDDDKKIKSFLHGILPIIVLTGIVAGLIIAQPNLSTAITVCGIVVGMMLIAGMKVRYFYGLAGIGVLGILFILLFKQDSHWYSRLTSFIDPFADRFGSGYQASQSLIALGSGGLFGVGLGKSVQKNLYLPEPQNDFILAIIGEETGFIGMLILIVIYCLFIWRGIHIAINAPDQFGLLAASGIVLMVAIQVVLNIGIVTSSIPATGVSLPFISYGGNALVIFMFATGVLVNISRHEPKNSGVD